MTKGPENPGASLDQILKNIQDKKLPPVHLWNPKFFGDIDIEIRRDGTWFYNGTPIGRKRLVQLFSTVLRRDGKEYFLVTPVEKLKIKVEDAPFLVVEVVREGEGVTQVLSFRTQTDDWVIAGKDNPIRVSFDPATGEPSPYILVRDNLEALINRPVFYELVEIAEHVKKGNKEILGIRSGNEFFALGEL
ncbi:MAG: DUF1285 domain-containing protein [Alphaproteobacteria bacterium]